MVQCVNLVAEKHTLARQCRSTLIEASVTSISYTRDPQFDLKVGNLVIRVVSTLDRIEVGEFTRTSRGRADICLARQMAMYLMHTVFSCPYHRVAAFFGRDRTTISHACRLIEDARDDRDFDKRLEVMENLLVSARALGELAEHDGVCHGN